MHFNKSINLQYLIISIKKKCPTINNYNNPENKNLQF